MNEEDKGIKGLDLFTERIVCIAIGFVIGAIMGLAFKSNTSTPVERNNVIDSLTTINDSLKIKVDKLDSVKNAKVIEVSTLDNDSTRKLFYQLVSE